MRNIKSEIAAILAEKVEGLSVAEIEGFIEIPVDKNNGDYAFPCFRLAKLLRKAPPQIASQLSAAYDQPELAEAQAVNGLNHAY